jgi:hypothetical protein
MSEENVNGNDSQTTADTDVTAESNVKNPYEKHIKELRSENANRRVENKQLKEELAKLQEKAGQVDQIPDLLKKLTELETTAKTQAEDAVKARREAALTKVAANHKLSPEVAKLLEYVPDSELEITAATLAKSTTPASPFGVVSAGNSAAANDPSLAKRIFDRINNTNVNVYDPKTHTSKGGGVFTE